LSEAVNWLFNIFSPAFYPIYFFLFDD
jgi:hypothetical protein